MSKKKNNKKTKKKVQLLKKKKTKDDKKDSKGGSRVHAFRADSEISKYLDSIPNKTEFILDALEKSIGKYKTCPKCGGTGLVVS